MRTCYKFFMVLILALTMLVIAFGCDSGEMVVDEVTGNRAVKQYHKSKEDIQKIVDQQAERYKSASDGEEEK